MNTQLDEIRTADFRFHRENIAHFESFCRLQGKSVGWTQDGIWFKATLVFQNKYERARFRAKWAEASLK